VYNLKIVGALHQILCPRELNYVSRSPHTKGATTTNTCSLITRKILILLSIATYKRFPTLLNTKENFKLNKWRCFEENLFDRKCALLVITKHFLVVGTPGGLENKVRKNCWKKLLKCERK
jgi:hypothetical protein